jgi:hypothetical protein
MEPGFSDSRRGPKSKFLSLEEGHTWQSILMVTVIFQLLTHTSMRTMIHITNTLTRVASQGPGQSIRISITTFVKPTRMDMHMGVPIIITTAIKPL